MLEDEEEYDVKIGDIGVTLWLDDKKLEITESAFNFKHYRCSHFTLSYIEYKKFPLLRVLTGESK